MITFVFYPIKMKANHFYSRIIIIVLIIFPSITFIPLFAQPLDVTIGFNPNNECSGTQISFTSIVTGGTPPFVYSWNFDDQTSPNNTSSQANPIHIFNPLGCGTANYSVSLTVTDTTGGLNTTVTATALVTIKKRPDPQLSELLNVPPFSNCYSNPPPTPANPSDTILVVNATQESYCVVPDSYSIDWGDGSAILTGLKDSDFPIQHIYTQLGAFNLKFGCKGTNDCVGLTTHVVKNESNPACGVSSPGQTQGCAPISFAFNLGNSYINNSPYTEYQWNFGDGSPIINWDQQTALDSNGIINHTFTVSSCPVGGEFVVNVMATNSCSSTSGTVDGVVIWSAAQIVLDTVGGCVGQPVTFSNQSVNGFGPGCTNLTEYSWVFGNGNTYTGYNPPPQIYLEPGVYFVLITGDSYCGETTLSLPVIIDEPPTAAGYATPLSSCVSDSLIVNFTNQSTGENLKYLWSVEPDTGYVFVSNTDSTAKDPSIQFTVYGDYLVTLTTTNNCDVDYKTFDISIHDKPSAEFSEDEIVTCDSPFIYSVTPDDISYDDHGEPITAYNWYFVGGNPGTSNIPYPANISYPNSGNFTARLITQNNCGSDTTLQIIEIITQVDPVITPDTAVCFNSPGFWLFADPDIGNWEGEIVDENGFVTTNTIGTFCLKYTDECLVPDSMIVTIHPLPQVEILSADVGVCVYDDPLIFTGLPAGGIWQGNGIANPNVGEFNPSLSGPGQFQVFYSYSDSFPNCVCFNSDEIIVTVDSKPEPDFLPADTSFCAGIEYIFTNYTLGGNNNEILWEFSDGFTSSSSNEVIHTFADTGNYWIKISASSLFGCIDSTIRYIRVIQPPPNPYFTMDFTPSSFCSPVEVNILFDPTVYDDFITFDWNFGNGGSLTSKYSFSDTTLTFYQGIVDTTYYVSLEVINQCGTFIYLDSVVVHAPPIAGFGKDFNWNCSPKPVTFINKSLGIADSIYWDFGDGTDTVLYYPQMDQILKHSFYTEVVDTVFNISMITYNTCGTDTISDYIEVFPNTLTAFFNTDTTFGCSPLTANFTNYSSPHTLHNTWAVINGTDTLKYINKDFTYTFRNSTVVTDTFLVQLWIDDNCSRDTAFSKVVVYPVPEMNFQMSINEICAGEIITFENQSNVADFYWDFGDGTILYPQSNIVDHVYDSSGQYEVLLIGRSVDFGCWDTLSKIINIKPTPQAFIQTTQTAGCAPFGVYFESDSSFNKIWDFGDQSQLSVDPFHVFFEPGLFKVTMISEFENFCSDTAFLEIRVLPRPQSDFTINSLGGYPEKVQLTNISNDYISCEWILPDNESVFDCENLEFDFDNIGSYPITLITTNAYDCNDTVTKSYDVYFKGLFIPDAFSPNNPGEKIREFKAVGIGLKEYYLEVYDTYGNLLWRTDILSDSKPANGWDGSFDGKPLQQDVYMWKADAVFLDNTIWQGMDNGSGIKKKFGTVTLIR